MTITSRVYKHNLLKLWAIDHIIYGNLTIESKLFDSKFLYDLVMAKILWSDRRLTINEPCTFAV